MNIMRIGHQASLPYYNNNYKKTNYQSSPAISNCTSLPSYNEIGVLRPLNISFKGKYNLTRLPDKDLKEFENSVVKKAREQGAYLNPFSRAKSWDGNYAIQAVDKLIKDPIAKKGNTLEQVDSIYTSILTNHSEKRDAEALMEMIDFLSSKDVKKVVDHPSVRENIGDILFLTKHNNLESKKDLINHLNEKSEILAKDDVNFGSYVQLVNEYNYSEFIDMLNLPKPPKTPMRGETTTFNHRVDEVTRRIKEEDNNRVNEVVETAKEKAENNPDEIKGFARVGGQKKAIDTIRKKVIFPRLFPELYKGRNIEKGAIMTGPPGTGKSLMAKALSEECNCKFFSMGAGDMKEKWVGSTEENWRNLFNKLKTNQPSILFIDEADSLCKKRGGADVHGDSELNQFLKLVSDVKSENVDTYILLATNNIKAFDDAILRDGRFGTRIEMLPPENIEEVEEIFNIHKRGLPMDKDVEENKKGIFNKMLKLKLTGANIEGVVNQSHEDALTRLGLFEKMLNGTVTKEDTENFRIKAEDIYSALEKRNTPETKKIGFNP